MTRTLSVLALGISLCFVLNGCIPAKYNAVERRQRLLVIYPPGTTTRADVQKRLAPGQPEASEARPPTGWDACPKPWIQERVSRSEQRTGTPVYRCEGYLLPDGASGGLCLLWFFYDKQDRISDVEWQYHTD
jgi:hypothetical protein